MEIQVTDLPQCLIHKRPIAFICTCSSCVIPNPFICAQADCQKVHAHPLQHVISTTKLNQLLKQNTASLKLLQNKARLYFEQVRLSLCHEIEKISEMMNRALEYKHTHPVYTKIKEGKYNELSPQRMFQLISYLRGSRSERNSMEFVKNEIYEGMEKIEKNRQNLLGSVDFRKLMLYDMIDLKSIQNLSPVNISTNILDSEEQFTSIISMLERRYKKSATEWELIYRASDQAFSSNSYLLNIQNRSHLLMLFKTDMNRKFGCFLNMKIDKKDGWLCDGTGSSFIFSLDHNQIYPMRAEAKYRVKAAYIGDKGPQIGCGCDIYISDSCDKNRGSGSNLGGSYELPPQIKYGSRQAKQRLAGEQNFTIAEYQIYQLH